MMNQLEQRPKAALLQTLNRIRALLRDIDGRPIDLLKNAKHAYSTLGIKLVPNFDIGAQPVANIISECIQGSPAHISGQIEKGDVVLAINGTPLDFGNATNLLGTSNMLGGLCTLTLKRGEEILDIQLTWTSAVFVRDMNILFRLFETLEAEIRKQTASATSLNCLQELIMHTIEMEKNRSMEEEQLASKLLGLQLAIVEQVDDIETYLHHSMSNDLVPRQELIGAMFEAKHLHENLMLSREKEAETEKRLQDAKSRIQDLESQLVQLTKNQQLSDMLSTNASTDLSMDVTVSKDKIEGFERHIRAFLDRGKIPHNDATEIQLLKDKIGDLENRLRLTNESKDAQPVMSRIADLEARILFAKQLENDLRWQLQVAADNEKKAQKELHQAKQSLASSMLLLDASKADIQEQVRIRKGLESEVMDLRNRFTTLTEASRADVKEQAVNRDKELASCKSEVARLEAQLSSLSSVRQELAAIKVELTQCQQLSNMKGAEIAKLQGELTATASRDHEIEASKYELARLKQLLANKDTEVAELQGQLVLFKALEQELGPLKSEAGRHAEVVQRKDAEIAALQEQLRREKENWSPLVVRTGIAELEVLSLRARNAELEKLKGQHHYHQAHLPEPGPTRRPLSRTGSASLSILHDDTGAAAQIEHLQRELERQRAATAAAEKDVVMHIAVEQDLRDRLHAQSQELARLTLLLGVSPTPGDDGWQARSRAPPRGSEHMSLSPQRDGREKVLMSHVDVLREKIANLEGQAQAQLERK